MCLGAGLPCSGWSTKKGHPFQVRTKVQCELMSLHARGCSPLTEILMILSNMTSGETWKSKTKYWRGEGPRPAVTGGRWAAANGPGAVPGPAPRQCLSAPRPFPLSPEEVWMTSGGNHWSSLTLGAGGRLDLNRRARPQPLGRASTSNYGQGKEMGTVDGMVHADFLCFEGSWAGELGN